MSLFSRHRIIHLSGPVVNIAEKSLYERFGGIYPIALVVDRFSDKVVENPNLGSIQRIPS